MAASKEGVVVGRFFHSTHVEGWQGRVISEPRPGVYMIETYDWLGGLVWDETLRPIEQMSGWSFYDSAEEMRECYEHQVAAKWERAREKVSN